MVLNIVLWVLQGLLSLVYLAHGWLFLTMTPAKAKQMAQRNPNMKPLSLPPALRIFVGIIEPVGVLGLLLPGITHILPWLTPLAAAGLAIIMVGAIFLHLSRRETSQVIATAVLLLLLLFLVVMRWQVQPL